VRMTISQETNLFHFHVRLRLMSRRSRLTILATLIGLLQFFAFHSSAFANSDQPAHPLSLADAYDLEQTIVDHSETYPRIHFGGNRPHSLTLPVGEIRRGGKLRIHIPGVQGGHSPLAFRVKARKTGQDLVETKSKKIKLARANLSYDFSLPIEEYDAVTIEFYPSGGRRSVLIRHIEIVPSTWIDHRVIPYLLTVFFALALLIPGALVLALVAKKDPEPATFQILLFLLSIAFLALGYAMLHIIGRVAFENKELLTAGILFALLGVVLVATLKQRNVLLASISTSRYELLFFLFATIVLCYLTVKNTPLPVQNFDYRSIAGPKTFDAFRAHDPQFQYFNAKALANGEPFKKYYGDGDDRKLFYLPQDREMLPGASFAVLRTIIATASYELSDSFLAYALFGIVCNLMIVFPLLALARRFIPERNSYLVFIFVILNACIISNIFLSWFKLAGAALFLSGVYVLLQPKETIAKWVIAGALFGAATNMHAGNALGIPLVFLWFSYRGAKEYGWKNPQWLAGPASLVGVFGLLNLPWSVIKRTYFTETHTLLKEHFLGGVYHPDGIWASVKLFFHTYPVGEQVTFRLGKITEAFQFETLGTLTELLTSGETEKFFKYWDGAEFQRLAILFYPLTLFVIANWLITTLRRSPNTTPAPSSNIDISRTALLIISLVTIVSLVIVRYGRYASDITYFHPMGIVLLLLLFLTISVLRATPWITRLYYGYLALTYYRLERFL